MKKYPKYQLRVSEELDTALKAAGTDVVRKVLQDAFLGAGVGIVAPGGKKEVVATSPETFTEDADVERKRKWAEAFAANEAKMAARRAIRGVFSFSGSAVPDAGASVPAPRKSMEELRAIAAGQKKPAAPVEEPVSIKTYQQMPPKVDPYAMGDPEPPED